ncbi:hypothetical protein BG262_06940 [Floricoccus penangensis]|uniref:DUF4352 domain-containing protein n=1 Tax=Floricoccus penangensis TaxID=1859475 RepID=A0A9Q5JE67_9LACT|nr:hypothetical protein [Floricoccus penangensis]OFI45727.1 hypothetical protein BG262_06940 [Floricoccus penangensis]
MKKTKILTMTLAATFLAFGLAGCSQKEKTSGDLVKESDTVVATSDSSGNVAAGVESDFSKIGDFEEVATDSKNPKVKDTYEFALDYKDASWKDVVLSIDGAKVVDTEKFKEGDDEVEYSGALALHYSFTNDGDKKVKLHPEDATIILEDGTEIKATSFRNTLSSAFSKGDKEGYIHFKFEKSDSYDLAKIKSINISFKATAEGNDNEKEEHEFNAVLDPKK